MRYWLRVFAGAITAVVHATPRGVQIAKETRAVVRVLSAGDSLFFVRAVVRDVRPLRAGAIAMLTPRAIDIFSASGRPFTVAGGFANGIDFEVDPNDSNITIRDGGAQEWTTLDLAGKPLSHRPIERDPLLAA